jgi:hypothetical protein
VYAAHSGGSWQANLWDTTKGETVEGVIGSFLGEGMERYAQTAGYGRLLATPKNVMRSGHSNLFRPYYGRTNTFSNRNHHISRPVSPSGRATYQDRAGDVISMGNNPHRFILGVDDGLKQKLAGQWAREFAGGAILELAFAIPDIMEQLQNPYLTGTQRGVQMSVTASKAAFSTWAGAYIATAYLANAPVAVALTIGVGAGIVVSFAWDAIVPPTGIARICFLWRDRSLSKYTQFTPIGMRQQAMNFFSATIVSFLLGAPLYLPWLFVKFGRYKTWYLAPALPPLIYGRALYGWPLCAVFISPPFVALFGYSGDEGLEIIAVIGLIGVVCGFWMIIWTPDWAKPFWQRHLESAYSYQEIRTVFLPAWRKMDRREWSNMMETKEGIEELVVYARQGRGKRLG